MRTTDKAWIVGLGLGLIAAIVVILNTPTMPVVRTLTTNTPTETSTTNTPIITITKSFAANRENNKITIVEINPEVLNLDKSFVRDLSQNEITVSKMTGKQVEVWNNFVYQQALYYASQGDLDKMQQARDKIRILVHFVDTNEWFRMGHDQFHKFQTILSQPVC